MITDQAVPALGLLLGPEVADLLEAVLTEAGGQYLSARTTQVRYVPGKSVTAQYATQVRWPDGTTVTVTMVAASGIRVPEGTVQVETGEAKVALWRYPNDPFLPGLAPAADPERVGRLLSKLGAPTGTVRLRRRAYRPGRRAVIEVVSPQARVFLKVVRPDQVADLQEKHTSMAGQVPVPHSYGWSEEMGLVAIQAMPGKTLRKAIESGSSRLPTAAQLVALLDGLPAASASTSLVAGPIERATDHSRLLKSVLPDLTDRIDTLIDTFQGVDDEAAVSVHGDFHTSQVLTKGASVVGLIDVDTAGRGARANDLASMLGHVSVLSTTSAARRRASRYGASLISDFDLLTDPSDLRRRVAAMVFGYATGPFRVQQTKWATETERRIALAEQWANSAADKTRS
ncbi:MAG: aminoglycoside phosphotransferase family protein [Actinomycetota bacterium]|nr:aminoglycoside phosphotransferase family protein [Actinomycetota bacterium]